MPDINAFLKRKHNAFHFSGILLTDDLYSDIHNSDLKFLFSYLHQRFNALFKFMYSKKRSNGHFNAEQSRELIELIELYKEMSKILNNSQFSFSLNESYIELINSCDKFLCTSNGSAIPDDLPIIDLVEYDPIFTLNQTIKIPQGSSRSYPLEYISKGSYAEVYKYFDEYYNKYFCVKKAFPDLDMKEQERFRREYESMKKLSSPYILEVYAYSEQNHEYTMEFADETLADYIRENPDLPLQQRKRIAKQVLQGLKYIHSKGLLHRDLSLTNILLKQYKDGSTIVKISDFGLVKERFSNLTSVNSDFKGSFNDPALQIVGFSNYSIEHETYALTRLIYYIMTGRFSVTNDSNAELNFIKKGLNPDSSLRYHSVDELWRAMDMVWT